MLAWMGGKKKLMALARHKQSLQKQRQKQQLVCGQKATAVGRMVAMKAGPQQAGAPSEADGSKLSSGRARRKLEGAFGQARAGLAAAGFHPNAAAAPINSVAAPQVSCTDVGNDASASDLGSSKRSLGAEASPPSTKPMVPPRVKRAKVAGKPTARLVHMCLTPTSHCRFWHNYLFY
jgi:hypothetical protein